jgi:hypothetical protein
MHPAGGEYVSHPAHAAHTATTTESYAEYARPARAAVADHQASQTSSQAGADTTPGDGSSSASDTYSYDNSNTPQAATSSDSTTATRETAAASLANVHDASAAVAQHSAAAPAAAQGSATGPERPQPPPAATTRADSGALLVAEATHAAADRALLHAARPRTADIPEPLSPPATVGSVSEADRDAEEAMEPGGEVAENQAAPAPQVASLLTGNAPVDLLALDRGVDHFFSRLEDLGRELPSGPVLLRLAPWVVAVSAATAALELARWQMKKQGPSRSPRIGRPFPDNA